MLSVLSLEDRSQRGYREFSPRPLRVPRASTSISSDSFESARQKLSKGNSPPQHLLNRTTGNHRLTIKRRDKGIFFGFHLTLGDREQTHPSPPKKTFHDKCVQRPKAWEEAVQHLNVAAQAYEDAIRVVPDFPDSVGQGPPLARTRAQDVHNFHHENLGVAHLQRARAITASIEELEKK